MAPPGLLNSLVAAIQASLSVLLVIFYGGVAAWLQLLNPASTKAISKICVRMFLPALLLTQIGSQLHAGSADRYAIILIWAIICHVVSFLIGIGAHLLLGMPDWTTVAIMFNNTTSYPLLLIAALDETGILRSLVVTDETTRAALERAKSYFLVFATVSSCLTFAVGPRLIDSEHAPEPEPDKEQPEEEDDNDRPILSDVASEPSENTTLLGGQGHSSSVQFSNPFAENAFFPSARKPSSQPRMSTYVSFDRRASVVSRKRWARLGPRTKWWLLFISDFFNAPLLGAILGVIIGLTPTLHRAFFEDTEDGGIFTAWFTASLKSIGSLFVPLPVVVAGVSLYTAMKEARQNREAGTGLPWITVTFILVIRFVIWPLASIATIYALASKTDILGPDPMLWFALMLMPTGPPAMKLITLIQVSDGDEEDETSIAKLLTVSLTLRSHRAHLQVLTSTRYRI